MEEQNSGWFGHAFGGSKFLSGLNYFYGGLSAAAAITAGYLPWQLLAAVRGFPGLWPRWPN